MHPHCHVTTSPLPCTCMATTAGATTGILMDTSHLSGYPLPAAGPLDPPAELADLRGRDLITRVAFEGASAWLLTRHANVRAVLADSRFVPHVPGVAMTADEANASGLLFAMHGEPHARLRRMLARSLSARRIAGLRPAVQRLADSALADLATHGPPADLLRGYAAPLAAGTLSELLGVDLADRSGFEAMAAEVNALFATRDPADAARRGEELNGFLARLIAERRAAPDTDLLSELVTTNDADGTPLRDDEVHGLAFSLLGAGLVPPALALTLATLRLLLEPAAADTVRRDPGRLPAAVDELLRLDPGGAGNTDRVVRAVADVELAGAHIAVGEFVILPLGSANRDPDEFADPGTLRLDRTVNRHLSFGPGLHHCLGAALARLQLEIGLGTLLAALPDLALAADPGTLDWQHGMLGARNLAALPIAW